MRFALMASKLGVLLDLPGHLDPDEDTEEALAGQGVQNKTRNSMSIGIFGDLSRLPSEKERASFGRRLRRLADLETSVAKVINAWGVVAGANSRLGTHLRIRSRFAYQENVGPAAASDRSLPARKDRPPATRIVSPNGAALRFYLTAQAEAQARARPGSRPVNTRPLRPPDGRDVPAWVDLLASSARVSGKGRTRLGVQDKKLRQLQNVLDRLASPEVQLVALPHGDRPIGTYEGFQLLDEGGGRMVGDPVPYAVPKLSEAVFHLPISVISNGWIHVLEDTEISILLMVACGRGSLIGLKGYVAFPGDVRLLHYGIGRDAYTSGLRMLERLELVDVQVDPSRHLDGKVENYHAGELPQLHRLRLLEDGFSQSSVETMRAQLEYQLER